jgi:DNA-directed RNA polymerase specialized sigma24 family protein
VVQKIVRRKIAFSDGSESSDMVQGIALRLWKWRDKFREKSEEMSPEEWQSFAARTAYNEINRYFSSKNKKLVSLDEASEVAVSDSIAGETGCRNRIALPLRLAGYLPVDRATKASFAAAGPARRCQFASGRRR